MLRDSQHCPEEEAEGEVSAVYPEERQVAGATGYVAETEFGAQMMQSCEQALLRP